MVGRLGLLSDPDGEGERPREIGERERPDEPRLAGDDFDRPAGQAREPRARGRVVELHDSPGAEASASKVTSEACARERR
jgi:hypothetical protein